MCTIPGSCAVLAGLFGRASWDVCRASLFQVGTSSVAKAPWWLSWVMEHPYGRFLWKYHLLHHAHQHKNFNLVLIGDLFRRLSMYSEDQYQAAMRLKLHGQHVLGPAYIFTPRSCLTLVVQCAIMLICVEHSVRSCLV